MMYKSNSDSLSIHLPGVPKSMNGNILVNSGTPCSSTFTLVNLVLDFLCETPARCFVYVMAPTGYVKIPQKFRWNLVKQKS